MNIFYTFVGCLLHFWRQEDYLGTNIEDLPCVGINWLFFSPSLGELFIRLIITTMFCMVICCLQRNRRRENARPLRHRLHTHTPIFGLFCACVILTALCRICMWMVMCVSGGRSSFFCCYMILFLFSAMQHEKGAASQLMNERYTLRCAIITFTCLSLNTNFLRSYFPIWEVLRHTKKALYLANFFSWVWVQLDDEWQQVTRFSLNGFGFVLHFRLQPAAPSNNSWESDTHNATFPRRRRPPLNNGPVCAWPSLILWRPFTAAVTAAAVFPVVEKEFHRLLLPLSPHTFPFPNQT